MDKVSDLLIRIKNGYLANRKEVEVNNSKLNQAIMQVLKDEGYVVDFKVADRIVKVTLKYDQKSPAMTDVKRVSKPGRRVYSGAKAVPRVLNGLGIAIVSTPKGVMTDRQAKKEGVGGEVMAFVW